VAKDVINYIKWFAKNSNVEQNGKVKNPSSKNIELMSDYYDTILSAHSPTLLSSKLKLNSPQNEQSPSAHQSARDIRTKREGKTTKM